MQVSAVRIRAWPHSETVAPLGLETRRGFFFRESNGKNLGQLSGNTLRMFACDTKTPETVTLLLEKGATARATDYEGKSAIAPLQEKHILQQSRSPPGTGESYGGVVTVLVIEVHPNRNRTGDERWSPHSIIGDSRHCRKNRCRDLLTSCCRRSTPASRHRCLWSLACSR